MIVVIYCYINIPYYDLVFQGGDNITSANKRDWKGGLLKFNVIFFDPLYIRAPAQDFACEYPAIVFIPHPSCNSFQ